MYLGFTILVSLFVVTVMFMLDGIDRIHNQLKSITTDALPLVSASHNVSLQLLVADKIFKDYLTSQDPQVMTAYSTEFEQQTTVFQQARNQLQQVTKNNPQLKKSIQALTALEQRYFTEATVAMTNYRLLLLATNERQQSSRQFQQLQTELNIGMKEFINEQDNLTVKMLSKNYFLKLKETETITLDALASDDTTVIEKAIKSNKISVNHLKNTFRSLSVLQPELKQAFNKSVEQYSLDIGRAGGVLDQHFEYIQAQHRLYSNIATLAKEINQAMDLVGNFNKQANSQMSTTIATADMTYTEVVTKAIIIGIAVILLAIIVGWYLARSVRRPLMAILKTLEALTTGNMTQRTETSAFIEFSQLSHHINMLAQNLQQILTQISHTSAELSTVATENHTTTAEAKQRLNNQRQQTASAATAMVEMEHSVTDVSKNIQITMERVNEVEQASATGREVMTSNINTAHQLSTRLDESVHAVEQLQKMSSNIGSILDVIRNIADQTNLLALNAAIEAARAGEQGRGFAVVADEVRVLAKRTTDSTAEIEAMIKNLQTSSGQAMNMMQSCVIEMDNSISLASNANSSMEEIQAIIIEISDMSSQIAQAAEEQRCTTTEIARSLEDISHIADNSYNTMEEMADTGVKLEHLATEQNTLVSRFKL
ncbi:methyl-accepting chemotaxis protein [Photobacterium iliopiscarium]|uniref:Methyl-accepting chemotaxis protein n=1 Tax=Photobacterium iliopiscarium TaxID=56192 RepID=A0A2T3MKC9_9GAMM|nr:methyl-accepting chemotaxis protein [Photobacterium iliopiscarium]KJG14698.1 chemotaxis protein [Photobacterium iliopiscarium]PSU02221.1 methyl-accepting chemotaxis protein [Photobacterium iliopiscarium]PSV84559.1 methyl-accepting chemotaxis protein [Photobacterium iliopiscarium]PSV96627.1 methyl-accepting chemotaxis protein [Photobacterium iliopiscarium]PSW99620.1 methyl-accepting chemotaxis protein [Photobacterium iliopiscarium]